MILEDGRGQGKLAHPAVKTKETRRRTEADRRRTGDGQGEGVLGGGAVEVLGVESGHGEVAGSGAAPFPWSHGLGDGRIDGDERLKVRPWSNSSENSEKEEKFQGTKLGKKMGTKGEGGGGGREKLGLGCAAAVGIK